MRKFFKETARWLRSYKSDGLDTVFGVLCWLIAIVLICIAVLHFAASETGWTQFVIVSVFSGIATTFYYLGMIFFGTVKDIVAGFCEDLSIENEEE